LPQLEVFLQAGCLVLLGGLLLAAAWQDLRTLRIGNAFALGIAASFGVWAAAGWLGGSLSLDFVGASVACAAALLGAGAVAFAIGMIGGGDVKLLAAVGLFAGPAHVGDLLLVTALAGGALGLALMAGAPIGPVSSRGDAALRQRLRSRVPYGPAIAAGGLWVATRLAVG
jgi:prepilin peptidase CpaA